MNLKKLAAAATAITCCATALPNIPFLTAKTYAAEIVKNDFEISYDGWYENADNVTLSVEEGTGYNGTKGMLVSGRQKSTDGASSEKGFYLGGNKKYDYSVKVFSEQTETFRITLNCLDPETEEYTVKELIEQTVEGGTWTELSAQYTAPAGSIDFRLDIATDSTADFRFDDLVITQKVKEGSMKAEAASVGLKDIYGGSFRVGNILNGGTINKSEITANIIKDYNSIECENETKPDATLVQSGSSNTDIKVTLSRCAAIMDFCVKNNIGMRGHAFVWHSQTPSWFFKDNFQNGGNWVSSSVMDQRLESYIKNMFAAIKQQYPTLDLYAYDVCNECVSDDSNRTANNGGARVAGDNNVTGGTSAWVSVYGNNSFVEKAFTYARKYAPEGCDLYYNDYNEYWDHKRDCIYNMCKGLYQKGLLDGVGMQSHVPANATGFAGTDSYITAMKKYLSIGCDVQVTELDISLESGKYSLQDQATKYQAIFNAASEWNSNPQSTGRVTAVCIWGPNDANSWLKSGSDALLYDKNNQPKLAYTTLMSATPNPPQPTAPIEPDGKGWYFNSTFEGSTTGWAARGPAEIMTSGRTAYQGSEALLVSERTSAWNGAAYSLNSNPFKPGETFSFSANVMYFDGGATDTFYMKLQYVDASGETCYDPIAEATALQGEWVQLANTNYTIPADATDVQLYIETAETTNNFYIDDVVGAVAGTVVPGAGGSKKIMLGDVDFSGDIDAMDIAAARKAVKDNATGATKLCADVDQSGKLDWDDVKYLQQFVVGEINEFPVAEKVVDMDALAAKFGSVSLTSSLKKDDENNPLYTQRFGADPGFLVYNDRLYVYTTNDAFEYDSNGNIKENSYDVGTINCISSADLVNWTDHGPIPVAGRNGRTQNGAAKWAFASWAPDACVKKINGKDKFFLYFANSGGGIGVLTADSPEGPWTDPIGKALVTGSTPNCSDVIWMFDPAVLVDDDGTGYLYFGGGVPDGNPSNPGTGRCVKLGDDMISLAGTPVKMDTPYLFEDSSILKIGDTYYYSYCTNWNTGGNNLGIKNAQIAYMTSKNPLGPFTYQGVMFKNTAEMGLDKGGNNHHSLVYFKNNYYLLYHARQVENRMGYNLNYRSPHIDLASFSNGKISVNGSLKGVSQIETLNPYNKVQAETIAQMAGVTTRGLGDTVVTDISKGDWIKVKGAEFSKGASSLKVKASSKNGCVIKVCAGGPSGNVLTYIEVPAGGSMTEIDTPVVGDVSGTTDITFVFNGDAEFDWWSFS